jgi:hypothetical protein
MNEQTYTFYRHSGKFGPHGPILAIIAAVIAGYPLGIVYSYLIKWIPFIYLNFLITIGYGVAFGFLTAVILKFAKVRNVPVAIITGLVVGLCAWYLSWNGHAHAMIKQGVPALLMPAQMLRFMQILNENGSWGIGSSGTPVTGVLLTIFWFGEALIMIVASVFLSFGAVGEMPFCETHGCWLDKAKKIEKLDSFVLPDQIDSFKAGSIAPLEKAVPRVPASGRFSRLTLKHSDQCEEFCTLSVSNVTVTVDKNGKQQEKTERIISNLLLPKTMLDYLSKFEHATATANTPS